MNAHFSTPTQCSNHVNNTPLYLQLLNKAHIPFWLSCNMGHCCPHIKSGHRNICTVSVTSRLGRICPVSWTTSLHGTTFTRSTYLRMCYSSHFNSYTWLHYGVIHREQLRRPAENIPNFAANVDYRTMTMGVCLKNLNTTIIWRTITIRSWMTYKAFFPLNVSSGRYCEVL